MAEGMQRLLIALYALWRNAVNRFSRKEDGKGRVLIIFQQVFGDAVVLSSALQGYVDLFVKQKGWMVKMICLPSVAKFLSEVAPVPSDINVEVVDFKRSFNELGYFRTISRKYRRYAELIIVPGSSLSAELLSTTLIAKRRIGMTNVIRRKWPPQLVVFERLAYTEPIVPNFGTMMIQRHRIMLNYLGLKDYKGKLPVLKHQKRYIEGVYCVICPGASVSVKRWPAERFAKIADFLIESKGWDVHVCGGGDEMPDYQKMISNSKHPEKIISHVGETTFSEWSSIIEYAQLVVGNDSATMHIAAGHRVKAVCVAGVYDKFQFFPYKVDELDNGDRLPETAYVSKSCEYCRTKGYHAGYGNDECKRVIEDGKCALCIEKVSVEMVKSIVECCI